MMVFMMVVIAVMIMMMIMMVAMVLMAGWLSMQVNTAWPAPCKRDQVIPCFILKCIILYSGKLHIQWENTISENALDETKTPYSMRKYNIREWSWWDENSILEIWDNLSSHLLALGCFSFEMKKYERTVFVWKQHLYVNVVLKQTWIYPFIAKSLLLVQPTPFGRQNAITRKWNNWSWKTAVHEAMKYYYKICLLDYPTPLP